VSNEFETQFLVDNFSIDEITKMSSIVYRSFIEMHNQGKMNEKVFNAVQDGILTVWTELMAMKYSQEQEG
jgi:hypothetical protein